ncbi:uncharacterized protein LOC135471061 [Liolophura sinensis]|uniref:uncharacterized protein LOC135471061 n=1 Tax=Liolophura sinensis TaxID=3198878 RepID=UPI0031593283
MTSSGDMWRAHRAPKENTWASRKTAGVEFVRDVSRHSRSTLFDTRPHITKGFHLPERCCSQRMDSSKVTLPNLSITSLSKLGEMRLNPITLSKSFSKRSNFDRMLKGKSLMSTAQYYELKRLYEGRPLTPKKQKPCRLGTLPKVRSITGSMEQTVWCLPRPLTLLPLTGERNAVRIRSNRTRGMPEPRLKVCLAKVDDKLLTMSAAEIPSPNSLLEIEKTKSASGYLPSFTQEHNISMQQECREGFVCPGEIRKSRPRESRRKPLSSLETLDLSTDRDQFTISETQERINLNLQQNASSRSRQRSKTTCTSLGLTCNPQVLKTSRTQPKTVISKPDVSVKLNVIGNRPRSLVQLRDMSRKLTVTPLQPDIDEEVLLETHTLRQLKQESQLNVTGKKMENKANMQIVNFLNYTRDYRLGHVVPPSPSCCGRMANHWTANDSQTMNLRKLRKGSCALTEAILSPIHRQEDLSLKPQRPSSLSRAKADEVMTLDYLVRVRSGKALWQREESTVQPCSSSSSSSFSGDSDRDDDGSSTNKSSHSIRSSSSEQSICQPQGTNQRKAAPGAAEQEDPPKADAGIASCSKPSGFPPIYNKATSSPYRSGHYFANPRFIHASGRISPVPASSRHANKRPTMVGRTLTAEQPVIFASSVRRLVSQPTPYRSPLPFPSKFETSAPKWRLPSFSHNPWGSLIMTSTPQEQGSCDTRQCPDRLKKATRKKIAKKPKVWRRKKRRQKTDSNLRANTDISSRIDEPQHSNSLYFTPMYDLRYDRWKRQCHRRKKKPACNLTIKATSKRSDISGLHLRSESEESEDKSGYGDGRQYPSPQKNTTSTPLHHPTPVSALGRPLETVASRHSSQQSGPLSILGAMSYTAPTPPGSSKVVDLPILTGEACRPCPTVASTEEYIKTPTVKGKRETHTELTAEFSKSGEELILSSSELVELECTGRICTCASGAETVEYPTDSERRPEYWNIASILRNSRTKKKQTTAGDIHDCSSRDPSSQSPLPSTVWVTDSLSVAPISAPVSLDTVASPGMRLQSDYSRKMGDKRTDVVNNRTLTLHKILGFLPDSLIQSDSREHCHHENGIGTLGVTSCSSCISRVSQQASGQTFAMEHAPAPDTDYPPIGRNFSQV